MTGRDARLVLVLQAQAREDRAAQEALREAQAAAEAMRDARLLKDTDLMAAAARRVGRLDPELLPARWAEWVRAVHDAAVR